MRKIIHTRTSVTGAPATGKASVGPGLRQITLCALSAAIIAGCASKTPAPGTAGQDRGFLGAVVADDPQAALTGSNILLSGGSAADAAIAMYFTMAVTLPSQASLGGGGVCLSYDRNRKELQALDFLARPSSQVVAGADRPTAIPGNIRGFYALHGLSGRLHWSQLLAPAENMARFGIPVSRTLAHDLAQVEDALAVEPQVRRIFTAPGGNRLVREGDLLVQSDLAGVIARVRTSGPGEFYSGDLGTRFAAGVAEAGGSLDRDELAQYKPVWRRPLAVGYGDRRAFFAPPPTAGGVIAGQMWAMLVKDGRYHDEPDSARDALLVETAGLAFADRSRWSETGGDDQNLVSSTYIETLVGETPARAGASRAPAVPANENPAAATWVAVDREGDAVACAVTLNSLFGTGRVATGTGIVLASLPGPGGRGASMLGPMMVIRPRGGQFVFAGSAAGGVLAPTSLIDVAARALLGDQTLAEASAAPRVHGGSDARFVYAEPEVSGRSLQILADRGYEIITRPDLGRVTAAICTGGLPDDPASCTGVSDPRGFGLSASTE